MEETLECTKCQRSYKYTIGGTSGSTRQTCNSCMVARRRKKIREQVVEYKGGKCQVCGYSRCLEALEFHHLDPTQKEFSLGSSGKSWKRVKAEADKCVLLCANCHREVEYGITICSDSTKASTTV